MKIALCVTLLLSSANGFVPQQAQRPRVAISRSATTTDLFEPLALSTLLLTAAWMKDEQLQPSLAWMPRSSQNTPSNDGMVTAMAMLKQAKLELSELSTNNDIAYSSSSTTYSYSNNSDDKDNILMKTRAEQWERSVFDAVEKMEYQIEQGAQATRKRSLQLMQNAVAPLSRLQFSFKRPALLERQKLETVERAVFDEMERLEQFIEQSASNTGAYLLRLVQAAAASIRNLPQARRAKIMYTEKLANMVRDMADRLERQAAKEKLAGAEEEEVWVTSVYRTRVRRSHRRRPPGIITSFLTRMARKVSAKWHRVH